MPPEEKYRIQGLVLYNGEWVKREKMEEAKLIELTKKLKCPPKKNPNKTTSYTGFDIDYLMKKGLFNQAINQIDDEISSGYYLDLFNQWRLRGLCYQKLDDYEEAIKNYDISMILQILEEDYMSKLDMFIEMAICYSKIGKFDDAMKFLN